VKGEEKEERPKGGGKNKKRALHVSYSNCKQ